MRNKLVDRCYNATQLGLNNAKNQSFHRRHCWEESISRVGALKANNLGLRQLQGFKALQFQATYLQYTKVNLLTSFVA